jgi:hypothetical protein
LYQKIGEGAHVRQLSRVAMERHVDAERLGPRPPQDGLEATAEHLWRARGYILPASSA